MRAISMIVSTARPEGTLPPRLENAAHEFEAQLMKELLRPMTRRDDETDSGSCGALADFAGEALGGALSRQGGFGIATSILQRLSQSGKNPQLYPESGKSSITGEIKLM